MEFSLSPNELALIYKLDLQNKNYRTKKIDGMVCIIEDGEKAK